MNVGLDPVTPPADPRNETVVHLLTYWPGYLLLALALGALVKKL